MNPRELKIISSLNKILKDESIRKIIDLTVLKVKEITNENNAWKSNIRKYSGNSINNRWLSVPENTWHQPIALSSDWVTITFHTASESEIIDEYKQ